LDFRQIWDQGPSDPRLPLWMSLHRDNVAEPRWDAQIFRTCSLLETIAREVLPAGPTPIVDQDSNPINGHDGQPATSSHARGALYALVRHCLNVLSIADRPLLAHPDRNLWDEIGVWVDIRNTVAHEGHWLPAPLPARRPAARDRVTAAFELAARGSSLDAGWQRYADTAIAAAEVVLRAGATGAMFPDE
jgi:hypothetical protein